MPIEDFVEHLKKDEELWHSLSSAVAAASNHKSGAVSVIKFLRHCARQLRNNGSVEEALELLSLKQHWALHAIGELSNAAKAFEHDLAEGSE